MTKSICSLEFGDLCKKLDRFADDAVRMLALSFDGLLYHNRNKLNESDQVARETEKLAKELTQLVLESNREEKPGEWEPALILAVIHNIQQIKYSVEKINASVHNKINDGVLFSDKAVTELKDVYGVALDCLRHVHDLMQTKNAVLVDHLLQRTEAYGEVIRKYTDEHENRLVRGICLPKASLIYLLIVDSLKDILWNVKTIAKKFKE
ncbi:MAG: hypothetical protein ACOY4Q_03955 [Bacillota bacterium]